MLPTLLSAALHTCTYVLKEENGSLSLIRMVDVLWVNDADAKPEDRQFVTIEAVALLKFSAEESSRHELQLQAKNPNGEVIDIGTPVAFDMADTRGLLLSDAPKGYHAHGPVSLKPINLGTHYLTILLDGVPVATTPLTLQRRPVTTLPSDEAR